ncbi:MAG: flagellar hook protein FlgE [Fusobacteriota bacterium]
MMPSLYSGVSGLTGHQLKMDVIGNNISNVNTIGYKKASVTFSDMLSTKISSAKAPVEGGLGGQNPIQVGLGSRVSSIDTNFDKKGSTQETGKDSDLRIDGDGMFMASDGSNNFYTRAGNFGLDSKGYLVAKNGMKVQGWQATKKPDGTTSIEPGAEIGGINIKLGSTLPAKATTRLEYAGNLNSRGGLEDLRIEVDADGSGPEDDKIPVTISFTYDSINERWNWSADNALGTDPEINGSGHFDLYSDGTIKESVTTQAITNAGSGPGAGTVLLDVPTNGSITFKEKNNAGNSVTSEYTKNVVVTSNKMYDSLGEQHVVSMKYTKSEENLWTWESSNPGGLEVENGKGFLTFDGYGQVGQSYMFAETDSSDLTRFASTEDAEGFTIDSYPSASQLGLPGGTDTGSKLSYYIPDGLQDQNGQYLDATGAVLADQNDPTLRVYGDETSPYRIDSSGVIKYRGSEDTTGNGIPDVAGNGDAITEITLSAIPDEDSIVNLSHTGSFSFDPAKDGGALPNDEGAAKIILQPDFNNVTQFSEEYGITLSDQNGYGMGELKDFRFSGDGNVIGEYSNGYEQPLGRIAIADFLNPSGLEKVGGSMFKRTSNSGEPQVLQPGSSGTGSIASGSLEMSNVDLAEEFTDMIVAQRGFQANSKTITTADQLLQELINLKR